MNKPKFRAYDEKGKVMRDVRSIFYNEDFSIAHIVYPLEDDVSVLFDNFILMQYTGLKDKNGNQYCQDDLVRYQGKIYRLIKGSYAFELLGFNESYQDNPSDFFSEGAYQTAEIVGNLYENPKLLSGVE